MVEVLSKMLGIKERVVNGWLESRVERNRKWRRIRGYLRENE